MPPPREPKAPPSQPPGPPGSTGSSSYSNPFASSAIEDTIVDVIAMTASAFAAAAARAAAQTQEGPAVQPAGAVAPPGPLADTFVTLTLDDIEESLADRDTSTDSAALERARAESEAVIVHSLLLQVPDVGKVTIDKLYAAGLTSLEVISQARADDIAATTGIPISLAERIVVRFEGYRGHAPSTLATAARLRERERLARLVGEMEQMQAEFARAADGWTEEDTANKRHLRHVRDTALLEAKVVLARLGEVARIAALERLPYERKLAALQEYLAEDLSKPT